jgi:hypothetical protein
MVLAREGVEVSLHAPPPKTEQLWLHVWTNCHLEKCNILGKNVGINGCIWLPKMST